MQRFRRLFHNINERKSACIALSGLGCTNFHPDMALHQHSCSSPIPCVDSARQVSLLASCNILASFSHWPHPKHWLNTLTPSSASSAARALPLPHLLVETVVFIVSWMLVPRTLSLLAEPYAIPASAQRKTTVTHESPLIMCRPLLLESCRFAFSILIFRVCLYPDERLYHQRCSGPRLRGPTPGCCTQEGVPLLHSLLLPSSASLQMNAVLLGCTLLQSGPHMDPALVAYVYQPRDTPMRTELKQARTLVTDCGQPCRRSELYTVPSSPQLMPGELLLAWMYMDMHTPGQQV